MSFLHRAEYPQKGSVWQLASSRVRSFAQAPATEPTELTQPSRSASLFGPDGNLHVTSANYPEIFRYVSRSVESGRHGACRHDDELTGHTRGPSSSAQVGDVYRDLPVRQVYESTSYDR